MDLVEALIIGLLAGVLIGIAATLSFQSTANVEYKPGWECPDCGTEMKQIPMLGSTSLKWNCPKCNPWESLLNKILVDLNDVITEMRRNSKEGSQEYVHPILAATMGELKGWTTRLSDIYEKLTLEDKVRRE